APGAQSRHLGRDHAGRDCPAQRRQTGRPRAAQRDALASLPQLQARAIIGSLVIPREAVMQLVSFLLNVLWILIGGAWMAFGWLVAAVIMAITIIGIPWARAAFNIAVYTLLPFGSRAVSRYELTGMEDVGTGPLGVIGNIIWFVLAGWWL